MLSFKRRVTLVTEAMVNPSETVFSRTPVKLARLVAPSINARRQPTAVGIHENGVLDWKIIPKDAIGVKTFATSSIDRPTCAVMMPIALMQMKGSSDLRRMPMAAIVVAEDVTNVLVRPRKAEARAWGMTSVKLAASPRTIPVKDWKRSGCLSKSVNFLSRRT